MKANKLPTAAELRLGPQTDGSTADEAILNAIGDPAYLHELGPGLKRWSRKQIEKAINRLLAAEKIVSFGQETRRLYASYRPMEEILRSIPAGLVRVLQYIPIAGGVEQESVAKVKHGPGIMVKELVDMGLLVRVPGPRYMLMLSAFGRRVRTSLGDGLSLPPETLERVEQTVGWWPTLERLATTGSMLIRGSAENGQHLIKQGSAIIDGGRLVITESGRDGYHAHIDLVDITRMLESGIAPSDIHIRLMEQHLKNRMETTIMPKTAAPKPQAERRLHAYLLMRTDMPSLGIGKSRAQAMYAGNNMTHELYVKPLKAGLKPHADVEVWHDQGAGFGTAIAIGARNEVTFEVLEATIAAARRHGFMAGLIVDERYPYNVSDEMLRRIDKSIHTRDPQPYRHGWRCYCRETTAGWILGDKSELEELLSRFNLTPHAERERDQF